MKIPKMNPLSFTIDFVNELIKPNSGKSSNRFAFILSVTTACFCAVLGLTAKILLDVHKIPTSYTLIELGTFVGIIAGVGFGGKYMDKREETKLAKIDEVKNGL